MTIKKGLKPLMQHFYLNDFSLWPVSRKEVKTWQQLTESTRASQFFDIEIPTPEEDKPLFTEIFSMIKQSLKKVSKKYYEKIKERFPIQEQDLSELTDFQFKLKMLNIDRLFRGKLRNELNDLYFGRKLMKLAVEGFSFAVTLRSLQAYKKRAYDFYERTGRNIVYSTLV